MTVETWRAEFYPTDAEDCKAGDAIEHSLQKWFGLRLANRERHGVTVLHERHLTDSHGGHFVVSSSSCALCECYFDHGEDDDAPCRACPLAVSRGGFACDNEAPGERNSPWADWTYSANPEPMIAALEKAKQDAGDRP